MSFLEQVRRIRELYLASKSTHERRQSLLMVEVFRPISFWMTPPFLRAGLSANQVTVFNWLVAAGAVAACAVGGPLWFRVAGGLYLLNYLLDLVDGNVARYRETRTHLGKFLDGIGDTAKLPLLYVALAIALYRHLPDLDLGAWLIRHTVAESWFVVAALGSTLQLMDLNLEIRLDRGIKAIALQKIDAGSPPPGPSPAAPPASGWRALPRLLRRFNAETQLPAWVAGCAWNRPDWLMAWLIACSVLECGSNIARNVLRARRDLDYPRP